ncbi:hypothetical protein MTBSS4_170022 [Magnetospirillum sp. SS-4]|nr:hypothetical protein MTBSS4_170022 [Magnetospirillum sp. SS-4]
MKLGHVVSEDAGPVSPPTRGRGLKLRVLRGTRRREGVAPHAGAWIETSKDAIKRASAQLSPPTRGRGLKPCHRGGRR